ncbi:MAG: DUF423 domain-containing protein [Granulosicoccaceae bacterium]
MFCAVAVIIGAFGAHALKPALDAKAMGWIDTGVSYQTTHALALIACGLLPASRANARTAFLFVAGIILFSGSLYLMALSGITTLGIITPIGGVCFIAAWASFCWMIKAIKN